MGYFHVIPEVGGLLFKNCDNRSKIYVKQQQQQQQATTTTTSNAAAAGEEVPPLLPAAACCWCSERERSRRMKDSIMLVIQKMKMQFQIIQ